MTYELHKDGSLPNHGEVFVFGSNLAGRHGKGAALVAAERFGAKRGVGVGYMHSGKAGPVHCYAVPTKDAQLRTLDLGTVRRHVEELREAASTGSLAGLRLFVTRIGCGLAGYSDKEVAPMFRAFPANCSFPEEWGAYLNTIEIEPSAGTIGAAEDEHGSFSSEPMGA
jgi:hypothetical protein